MHRLLSQQRRRAPVRQGASCTLANYADCNIKGVDATGVRVLGASPFGAIDMAGNGWEWVHDWYDANYYTTSAGTDPQGPTTGTMRVLRGGSYLNDAQHIVAFFRSSATPNYQNDNTTFRCAR